MQLTSKARKPVRKYEDKELVDDTEIFLGDGGIRTQLTGFRSKLGAPYNETLG